MILILNLSQRYFKSKQEYSYLYEQSRNISKIRKKCFKDRFFINSTQKYDYHFKIIYVIKYDFDLKIQCESLDVMIDNKSCVMTNII